jgi:DNA modification methylase
MDYTELLKSKTIINQPTGKVIDRTLVNPILKPHQRDSVVWGLRRGRCAFFHDTGLGKTLSQVEWARLVGGMGLIIAPPSVPRQTVREAKEKLGVEVHHTRSGADLIDGINITNYEMLHHFKDVKFNWVVLDESSILKSLDGKTRKLLTEMFADVPYRLCCTATPAPNDITELGRHAEFLGVMKDKEMLSAFFINDFEKSWRMKRHAAQAFYYWLATWAIAIRTPGDLGYDDQEYQLPPLHIDPLFVHTDYLPDGQLIFTGLKGITDRSNVRHMTLEDRVKEAAALVNGSDEQWIVWCGLNDESSALVEAIPGAVEVSGSQTIDQKTDGIEGFQDGRHRVIITKPKIAGMGLNLQNCHNMVFVGLGDSFEQYYQCIRRCYRFGQQKEVNVHIVLSSIEDQIYQNVMDKERETAFMMASLVKTMKEFTLNELNNLESDISDYHEDETHGDGWHLMLGDSCERMKSIPDNSVDLSVESLPFLSLFTYTPNPRDLGNSRDNGEFFDQLQIIIREKLRITKPGRNTCVHVQQVGATLGADGYIGIKDFRGDVIRAYIEQGWIFHGEVTIDKNPQIQAIRKKVKGLMFVQLEKDSAANRPGFADYILIFQKPGKNETPIVPECNREEWIQWAHPVWYDINETDVLNTAMAKGSEDERHICPLQLGLIERCIRLWSNRGETVFDPFNGIGSTGYEAVKHGRKYIGIELKEEYYKTSIHNLQNAERLSGSQDMFAWAAEQLDGAKIFKTPAEAILEADENSVLVTVDPDKMRAMFE